ERVEPRGEQAAGLALWQLRNDGTGYVARLQLHVRGQQETAMRVGLADDHRPLRRIVEGVTRLQLDEGPLLLDDEERVGAPGELCQPRGLERPDAADLVDADAEAFGVGTVEAEQIQRLQDVAIGLAG